MIKRYAHTILSLQVATILLVACSQEAIIAVPDADGADSLTAHVIGFASDLARTATRAVGDGELTTELLRNEGFGVYCWYTKNQPFTTAKTAEYMLMNNQEVIWSAGLWGYSPAKYWPLMADEMLTFRAYAPYMPLGLQTDGNGMPHLPVMVANTDYRNGMQHDPLWGTGRTDDYVEYGSHYTDYTYVKSGDELTEDATDGTIHWYFHHGMSKIMFRGRLAEDASDENVTIKSISISPLYTEGLLDISSPAGSASEKPVWSSHNAPALDMAITLEQADMKTGIALNKGTDQDLLDNGLLIIPRDFTDSPLIITMVFEVSGVENTATASVSRCLYGNTAYTFDLTLNPANPALNVRIRVNLDWQTGSHFIIDDL